MTGDIDEILATRYWPTDMYPQAHPIRITWDGVGTWRADNLITGIADAQEIWQDLATDRDEDLDHVTPDMSWRLDWTERGRDRLTLLVDGQITSVHIDQVTP